VVYQEVTINLVHITRQTKILDLNKRQILIILSVDLERQ